MFNGSAILRPNSSSLIPLPLPSPLQKQWRFLPPYSNSVAAIDSRSNQFFHCGHRHLLLLLLLLLLLILLPIPTALWMMLERNECNPHIILLLPLSSPFALGNRLEKEQWRCNGFWSLSLESCVEHIAHNEKKNCIGRESNPGRPRSA